MAPRPKWWHTLQGSKQEALLAVDLFNRPGEDRRIEAFIVHMQIAWLYLIHAKFDRDGTDYWYREANGRRVKLEDGAFKAWELARCIKEVFPNQEHPVRKNVEFFIGFRNRIEHKYEKLLEPVIAGKAQSLIMNYEGFLVDTFGTAEGLADRLRFPVFLTSLSDGAVQALKENHKRLPKRLTRYVSEFDAALSDDVRDDVRYEFRVYLIPQTGPKTDADVAMRFVRIEDLPDEQRDQLEQMRTVVRDRHVPVSNVHLHRPGDVCAKVSEVLGVRFTPSSDHARAWKHYKVRPATGAAIPKRTRSQYCVYDEPHGDYVFTDAWISLLTTDLRDREKFLQVIGHEPVPLPDIQSDLTPSRDSSAAAAAVPA
jgi:hypothetical protein